MRLGSRRPIPIDVRLVAATNVDLADAVVAGRLPRGPVLPPARGDHPTAAVARAPRRYPAAGRVLHRRALPAPRLHQRGALARKPSASCSGIPGRAISASWRTPSTTRRWSAATV
ncbi:sigma 54-interacting transcriptional regulator [Pseudomonas aeruginosa]